MVDTIDTTVTLPEKLGGYDITVTHPKGATEEQIFRYAAQEAGKFESNPLRKAEFASQGVVDSLLEAVGSIPDAVSFALRNAPGVPEALEKVGVGIPGEGYYKDALKKGFYDVGGAISKPLYDAVDFGPGKPVTPGERVAYGAGRGAGNAASFMLPGAAVGNLAKAGSTTANVGKAVASQPVMQTAAGTIGGATAELYDSDAAGLAASLATPVAAAMLRRGVSPVPRQLSNQEARLAQSAEDMGVQLTPGQVTGSRPLQTVESQLTQMPMASKPQTELYDAQRKAFNQEVLKRAGVNSNEATPEVIDAGFKRLGSQFNELTAKTELSVDRQFIDQVNEASQKFGRRLSPDINRQFVSYVEDIRDMAKAMNLPASNQETVKLGAPSQRVIIEGEVYQQIASDLRTALREAKGDPASRRAFGALVKSLDDLMARNAPEGVANQWKNVRRKYRNLLIVDDAVGKAPAADAVAGNIPFGQFTSAVRRADPRGYGRGRGEMNELARTGQFLANRIPDSGTAGRQLATNILTFGAGGAGGTGAAMVAPEFVAPAIAAPFVIPPMVQKAINSPGGRAYLTNQLMRAPRYPMSQTLGKIYSAQQGE